MRFLVTIRWDMEKGNELARAGTLGSTVSSILDDRRPEAAYFLAHQGNRSAILIVNLESESEMPAVAEPWFLALNATVEFQPVMLGEDLAAATPAIAQAVEKFG